VYFRGANSYCCSPFLDLGDGQVGRITVEPYLIRSLKGHGKFDRINGVGSNFMTGLFECHLDRRHNCTSKQLFFNKRSKQILFLKKVETSVSTYIINRVKFCNFVIYLLVKTFVI